MNQQNNFEVLYGITASPFGKIVLARTLKGISDLLFITENEELYLAKLQKKWKDSNLKRDDNQISALAKELFDNRINIKFDLQGTDFQLKVWKTLINLPENKLFTYKEIAQRIECSNSIRAVANAIGKNPIHYLIPCHRIIRADGKLGGYAAGPEKKIALLKAENLI